MGQGQRRAILFDADVTSKKFLVSTGNWSKVYARSSISLGKMVLCDVTSRKFIDIIGEKWLYVTSHDVNYARFSTNPIYVTMDRSFLKEFW